MPKHPRLPPALDALPRLYFTRQPAQFCSQLRNPEKAYGIRSASQLVREFEIRERRLRDIAVQRQANRQFDAFAVWVAASILALVIATVIWLHYHAS
jgi:hypothetical protein